MASLNGGFADKLRRAIKPLGYLLTLLALAYLANIIAHFNWNALVFHNPLRSLVYIVLFGIWASLFVLIGAYNWKLILEFLNCSPVPAQDVFQVYLKSNIAKYLPGNVMHFAGRNYLGNKLGWKHSDVAFSSLLEYIAGAGLTGVMIVIFIAAGLITIPPQIPLKINFHKMLGYSALGAAGGLILLVLVYAYRFYISKERVAVTSIKLWNRAKQFFTVRFVVLAVKLFLISLGCFLLNSLFYFTLCELVLDFHIHSSDFFNTYAALGIANYSGIITPGVPGGIGVKESVSFILVSAYGYPRELLMISILVYRVVCVLGDFFSFLLVLFFRDDRLRR